MVSQWQNHNKIFNVFKESSGVLFIECTVIWSSYYVPLFIYNILKIKFQEGVWYSDKVACILLHVILTKYWLESKIADIPSMVFVYIL